MKGGRSLFLIEWESVGCDACEELETVFCVREELVMVCVDFCFFG